jgi:flagellar motor switch protein FliG
MSVVITEPIDYERLNRLQKLALFLVTAGPEASSHLLKHFDDGQIEAICREITQFEIVTAELREKVMAEFSDLIEEGLRATLGGDRFARKAVELAKGDYKANVLLGRVAPTGNSQDVIKEVAEMEARQVYNLIKDEQPQTIAFVLSYLKQEKSAEVVTMLAPAVRDEVIERIGGMETTSVDHVGRVVQTLRKHLQNNERQSNRHRSGGVRNVADLLNLLDKDTSKSVLTKLEERNPNLGNLIRRKMFSFEDLVRLDTSDLQRITREVDMSDLVTAMKSADSTLQESIFNSVSKRAAETLREELELLGPVRLKDIEAAQDRIIQTVRRLEEEGEIVIDTGSSESVL